MPLAVTRRCVVSPIPAPSRPIDGCDMHGNALCRNPSWLETRIRSRWILCFAVVLACCAHRAPPTGHPRRWAEAWIDALNSQRLDHLRPLFAPNAVYTDPLTRTMIV